MPPMPPRRRGGHRGHHRSHRHHHHHTTRTTHHRNIHRHHTSHHSRGTTSYSSGGGGDLDCDCVGVTFNIMWFFAFVLCSLAMILPLALSNNTDGAGSLYYITRNSYYFPESSCKPTWLFSLQEPVFTNCSNTQSSSNANAGVFVTLKEDKSIDIFPNATKSIVGKIAFWQSSQIILGIISLIWLFVLQKFKRMRVAGRELNSRMIWIFFLLLFGAQILCFALFPMPDSSAFKKDRDECLAKFPEYEGGTETVSVNSTARLPCFICALRPPITGQALYDQDLGACNSPVFSSQSSASGAFSGGPSTLAIIRVIWIPAHVFVAVCMAVMFTIPVPTNSDDPASSVNLDAPSEISSPQVDEQAVAVLKSAFLSASAPSAPSNTSGSQKFCVECATILDPSARFCTNCGVKAS